MLSLTSPVIENEGDFPVAYTCNGRNISPPLNIADVPEEARSMVLVFEDPDAAREPAGSGKTFDHWTVYNISPNDQEIAEDSVPEDALLAMNNSGSASYVGPCPPTFRHKYIFRLYALDNILDFQNMPSKSEVVAAAEGHIIEQTELTAYYEQIKD